MATQYFYVSENGSLGFRTDLLIPYVRNLTRMMGFSNEDSNDIAHAVIYKKNGEGALAVYTELLQLTYQSQHEEAFKFFKSCLFRFVVDAIRKNAVALRPKTQRELRRLANRTTPRPEDILGSLELVEKAIAELEDAFDDTTALAFIMYVIHGFKQDEIARCFGMSKSQIQYRVQKAKNHLYKSVRFSRELERNGIYPRRSGGEK